MKVCVFLGASASKDPIILDTVKALGLMIAQQGHTLVYGAADSGLMGLLADTVLEAGGQVVGVMSKSLASIEQTHTKLSELHVVETMAERKVMLFNLGDCFVTLPGGLGTLEEFVDLWSALKVHTYDKPLYLLDPIGFYHHLLAFAQDMVKFGMVPQAEVERVKYITSVSALELTH
jgi:uncharacterized protein (TIGR00730 family)